MCTVDPWVVVESVEGEEQIVNDAVARYRERFLLTQVDGVWRVSYSEMLQELAETELCE